MELFVSDDQSRRRDQDVLREAMDLLVDENLVWSPDFLVVKHGLSALFAYEITQNPANRIVVSMAKRLVADA